MYFAVADIEQSVAKLSELGGTLVRPVFEVGVGHIAVSQDPQGSMFNMIQMTVPADD